jgi:uncharacterized protein (TIGR00251 family)
MAFCPPARCNWLALGLTLKIAVRLTPRGGRDQIDGWALDPAGRPYLKVRVSAPPLEGEANAALEKLLAKTFKIAISRVSVVSGTTARLKQIQIEGLSQEQLEQALPPLTSE